MKKVKYILLMVGGLAAFVTFGLVGTLHSWIAFFTIPLGFVLFIMGGNRLEKAIEEEDGVVARTFKRIWSNNKLCAAVGAGLIGLFILGLLVWEPLSWVIFPAIGFLGKALYTSGSGRKQKES